MRVVIPSVGYADMLGVMLPAWLAVLPAGVDARVVTEAADHETARVAAAHGATVVVTDAWRRDGAAFNKSAALDVGFGFDGDLPTVGEWCLALDADVLPAHGRFPSTVPDDTLCGCDRYLCLDDAALGAYQQGRVGLLDLPRRTAGHRAAGYFQLFRYKPGLAFGSFPTAGYYDLAFHQQFAAVVNLEECAVLHLGRTSSTNWKGRRVMPVWGAHG